MTVVLQVLSWLGVAVLAFATVYSWRAYKSGPRRGDRRTRQQAVLASALLVLVVVGKALGAVGNLVD